MTTTLVIRPRRAGRTSAALAAIMQEAFRALGRNVVVLPEDLHPATGNERTSSHFSNDVYRWSGTARSALTRNPLFIFDSYDTMTDCVKFGVTLSGREVYARGKSAPRRGAKS